MVKVVLSETYETVLTFDSVADYLAKTNGGLDEDNQRVYKVIDRFNNELDPTTGELL